MFQVLLAATWFDLVATLSESVCLCGSSFISRAGGLRFVSMGLVDKPGSRSVPHT